MTGACIIASLLVIGALHALGMSWSRAFVSVLGMGAGIATLVMIVCKFI